MMIKDLTEHQWSQLRYFSECGIRGEKIHLGLMNMSVLAALIRKNLITVTVTPEGQRTLDGPQSNADAR
jgi:hypothetical protein